MILAILGGIIVAIVIIIGFVWKMSSEMNHQMNNQMNALRGELNQRLQDTSDALRQTDKTVGEQLLRTTGVMGDVKKSLGVVEESYRQINEKMREISSLQDMLRPPQMRGGIGETLLENIITQVFGEHKEFYSFQHQFKNGQKVDAVIHLGKNIVSIDAKFPLESFQRLIDSKTDQDRKTNTRDFTISVKNKVDDIASKYILPDEGTSDFALMYIPTESIYYEIIKNETIWSYAVSKKVIPVSPNTFYPYLYVIWRGMEGQIIRDNINDVLINLARLKDDLVRFRDDFRVLGSHIKNAHDKFEDSDRRLERFSDRLSSVQKLKISDKESDN
ncbi:MAG: DNA recombination protein RmuC [Candidatus Omnitrophica bacterium]|nr:DNA recombination protein RmuC [Candidatus Omnitrophota bacterium]